MRNQVPVPVPELALGPVTLVKTTQASRHCPTLATNPTLAVQHMHQEWRVATPQPCQISGHGLQRRPTQRWSAP